MKKIIKITRLLLLNWYKIIWAYFTWMLPYSKHIDKHPLSLRYKKLRNLIIDVCKCFRIEFKCENIEYLTNRKNQTLLVSNHLSVSDVLLLISLSEKPLSFVAKKSVKKIPFVGRALTLIDGLFLDRSDVKQAVKVFLLAEKRMKENDISYCIYPEGTRNKYPLNGKVGDFHPGSLKIAYKNKADILPYAEFGTQTLLSNSSERSNYVCIKFFKPISYEEYESNSTPIEASLIHGIISNEVELMKGDYIKYYVARKNKKRPKNKFLPVKSK